MFQRCRILEMFMLVICLLVLGGGPSWATSADDECFFVWAEQTFPTFLAPAGAETQEIFTYTYRYYGQTNSYLGINSGDQHLYYLGPDGAMLDLGAYSLWQPQSQGYCDAPVAGQSVNELLDTAFGLSSTILESGLTDQLEPLMGALLGAPSTCPVVTTNLDLASMGSLEDINGLLANLPNPISLQADYGNGCTTIADTPTMMSGSLGLTVSNIVINEATGQISAQYALSTNQLRENGNLLATGSMSGGLAFNVVNMTGTANLELNNFQTVNESPANGTASLTINSATQYLLALDITDGSGLQANLNLNIEQVTDDRIAINTTNPGTLNQYTVVFNDVIFDSAICEEYPIGGSVVFSSGGTSETVNFNTSCNGNFQSGAPSDDGGTVVGCDAGLAVNVTNAYNGETISGVLITVGSSSAYSGADGIARFSSLDSGSVQISASSSGYTSSERTSTLLCNEVTSVGLSLSPASGAGALSANDARIVLSWGENPEDLDAHLTGPTSNSDGSITDDINRFHVYYSEPSVDIASLDTDDTDSYGPETITLTPPTFRNTLRQGLYRYSVHHFSGSSDISHSNASVSLTIDGMTRYYTPPAGSPGENAVWTVFEIYVDNLGIATIYDVNAYTADMFWESDIRSTGNGFGSVETGIDFARLPAK